MLTHPIVVTKGGGYSKRAKLGQCLLSSPIHRPCSLSRLSLTGGGPFDAPPPRNNSVCQNSCTNVSKLNTNPTKKIPLFKFQSKHSKRGLTMADEVPTVVPADNEALDPFELAAREEAAAAAAAAVENGEEEEVWWCFDFWLFLFLILFVWLLWLAFRLRRPRLRGGECGCHCLLCAAGGAVLVGTSP